MGPAFGRPSVLLITVAVCLLSRSHLSSSDPKPATATSTERCGGLSSDSESVLAERCNNLVRTHSELKHCRPPRLHQTTFTHTSAISRIPSASRRPTPIQVSSP